MTAAQESSSTLKGHLLLVASYIGQLPSSLYSSSSPTAADGRLPPRRGANVKDTLAAGPFDARHISTEAMARGGSAFLEPSQPSSHPSSSTLAANEASPRRNHGATSSWLNAAPTPSSLSSPLLNASPSSKSSSPLQSRRPATLQSRPLTRSITDSGLTTIRPASSGTTTTPGATDGNTTSARSSYFDTYQPYKLNPALTPSIKAKSSSSSSSASRSKSERNLRSRARYDAAGQAPMPELKRELVAATKDSEVCEVTTSGRDMLSASTSSSKSIGSQGIRPSSSSSAAPSPSIANFKATKLASEPDPPPASRSSPSNKAASVDAWRKMAAQAASRDPRGFASSTVVAGVTRRKSQQDLMQQAAAGAGGGQSASSASTLPAYRDVPLRRSPLPASMQEGKTASSFRAPVEAASVTSKVEVEFRPPTSSSYVAPTYAGSTAGMRKSSMSHPDVVKMPARSIDDIVREYKEKQAAAAAARSQPGQASKPALLSPAFDTSPGTSGPPTPMAPRQQLSPSAAARNAIDVDDYESDGSDDSTKREMEQTLGSDLPQTGSPATPRRQVRRDAKAASPNPSPRLVHATSFPSKLSTSSTSSSSSSSQQRHRKPSQHDTQTLPTRSSAADLPPWLTSTSAAAWLYEDPATAAGTLAAASTSSAARNRTVSLTSSHSARTTASSDVSSARRQASTSTTAAVIAGEGSSNAIESFIRSPRLTRILTLSRPPNAGLRVSLADVGDPAGHPTILYLGLGAVRYLAGLYDDLASALGLRLICIDRWGIGRTDNVPSDRRGILQWSSVVIEVADRLGLQRFSLLAHSAGAPYAMATALLHRQRVVGPVHLLAPWVSPEMETGYKWLRYVPEQIIRTAQAAEWRVAGWRLGKATNGATTAAAGGGAEVAQAAASGNEEESFDRAPLSRSKSPLLEGGRSATAIPTSASVPVVLPSPLTGLVPRSSSASAVATSSSSPTSAAPTKPKTTFLGSFFSSSSNKAASTSSSNPGRNASSSHEGSEPSRLDEVVQRGAGSSSLGPPSTPGSATTPFASSPSVGSAAGAGAGAVASPALSFLSSLYPSSLGELDSPVVGEQDPRLVNGLFSSSEWEELQDEESRTHQPAGTVAGIGSSPTSTLSNGSAASALPRRERSLHKSGPGSATTREGAPPSPTPSFSLSDRRMLLRAGIGGPSSTSSRSSSRSNSLRGVGVPANASAPAAKSASHHADLATALLRASHAEIYGTSSSGSATGPITSLNGLAASSNEALVSDLTTTSSTTTTTTSSSSSSLSPGTTSDLLTILGKSGPWGFTFTDVLPLNVSLRIWHGDKDERIGLGGAFWLQKEWGASGVECRLNVVKGAGHGLLTNGSVVVEVLESVAEGRERG